MYLIEDGRKGGNNRNISDSEIEKFLSEFKEAAEKDKIITVEEIALEIVLKS